MYFELISIKMFSILCKVGHINIHTVILVEDICSDGSFTIICRNVYSSNRRACSVHCLLGSEVICEVAPWLWWRATEGGKASRCWQ
jgi:hypothetical protein